MTRRLMRPRGTDIGRGRSMAGRSVRLFFFFQAEDGIRDLTVTGVQTCALPICFRGRTLESIAFSLSGPPGAYRAHLTVAATGLAARLDAHGAYAHRVFNGELDALAVNGSESLHLALERPVGLVVATDQMRIEWLCLTGTPGSMCADAEWSPVAWSTTVMSNQLPLNALTAGMTPGIEYLGTVNALARLSGGATTRSEEHT